MAAQGPRKGSGPAAAVPPTATVAEGPATVFADSDMRASGARR